MEKQLVNEAIELQLQYNKYTSQSAAKITQVEAYRQAMLTLRHDGVETLEAWIAEMRRELAAQ